MAIVAFAIFEYTHAEDFTQDFGPDFDIGNDPALPDYGFVPAEKPNKRLWRKIWFPPAPQGMLLWQDGRIKVVSSFADPDILDCDRVILGGHMFYTDSESWEATVLAAAGYPLVETSGG